MKGGINAWKGLVAEGAPEAGMAYFDPAARPEELTALAWILEEGSRRFYAEMARRQRDQGEAVLFQELAADEEAHESFLFRLYRDLSGGEPDPGFPKSLVSLDPGVQYLEGGMVLDDALEWTRGRDRKEILEFSLSLEANAIDLYVKMERKAEGKESKKVFQTVADQERQHLKRLTAALEKD
jgi:rubrerythrin